MSRPAALPGFDDPAPPATPPAPPATPPAPPAPPGGGAAHLDAAAACRAMGDLLDGRSGAARELRRLGFRVVPAQGRRIDVDTARDLFGRYAEAIAAGRFGEVAPLTRRLQREAGIIALWTSRRAEP